MESPYLPPGSDAAAVAEGEAISVRERKAMWVARVLGFGALAAAVVIERTGRKMQVWAGDFPMPRKKGWPWFVEALFWDGGVVPALVVAVLGAVTVMASYSKRRGLMLGLGVGSVMLALVVLGGMVRAIMEMVKVIAG